MKSIIYFEIVTTIALVLGILVAYAFGPGVGMNVDPASLDASAMSAYSERAQEIDPAVGFLMQVIPPTMIGAFAEGDILQVLVIAKGAHGIPGSAIVLLAATPSAVPVIPAIGLVLSVDWFMGMARALGNLIGNCVATVVIAAREGDISGSGGVSDSH